jgi:hypothetical protein
MAVREAALRRARTETLSTPKDAAACLSSEVSSRSTSAPAVCAISTSTSVRDSPAPAVQPPAARPGEPGPKALDQTTAPSALRKPAAPPHAPSWKNPREIRTCVGRRGVGKTRQGKARQDNRLWVWSGTTF